MIWATDLEDMLNKSQALAMQPVLKGKNVVIITNGGGIGVLGSDAAERHGIPLQTAPADVQAEFRKFMPDFGSPKNPVDITGGSGVAGYEGAIETALKCPWVRRDRRLLLRDGRHQGYGHRQRHPHEIEGNGCEGQARGGLLRGRRGQRGGR